MGVWRDPSLVRSHELKKRARFERCRWNERNDRHWRSSPPKKLFVLLKTGRLMCVTVYRDTLSEGFSHFVTSIAAPVASGWSGCRVGLTPTGKRRLSTAHTHNRH